MLWGERGLHYQLFSVKLWQRVSFCIPKCKEWDLLCKYTQFWFNKVYQRKVLLIWKAIFCISWKKILYKHILYIKIFQVSRCVVLIYRLCANFTEQCCASNILKKHIKLSLSWAINWNWTVRYLVLSANTCLYRIICAFLQAIMGTGWGLRNTQQASFDELNHLSFPAQISWPFSGEDYTLSSKRHWGPLCSHVP